MVYDILCIGSVLWDVIGRSASHMRQGSDVPGRITRLPGGVALNIAMALARAGLRPALLSVVGRDTEGCELIGACTHMGIETAFVYRSDDLPTDRYIAVEGANGLIAAIADAHSLESAGEKILSPLEDGRIGDVANTYTGLVALDGNLTRDLLGLIAQSPLLQHADLRVAPASPGKAERLAPFLKGGKSVLYVNLEEAGILCQRTFSTSPDAAKGLLDRGANRVLVTNGGDMACDGDASGLITGQPRDVLVTRVTGAGDTFMAAHMTAEFNELDREIALAQALEIAAQYVSGGTVL